jgi:hypothetical protein
MKESSKNLVDGLKAFGDALTAKPPPSAADALLPLKCDDVGTWLGAVFPIPTQKAQVEAFLASQGVTIDQEGASNLPFVEPEAITQSKEISMPIVKSKLKAALHRLSQS